MFRRCAVGLLAFALVASTVAQGVPKVLIVQAHVPPTREGDPNVPVAVVLSKMLDDTGRVTTVVWDNTDPAFRDALANGKIVAGESERLSDIMAGSRVFGAEYVLVFSAYRSGKGVKSECHFYRGGRSVWSDKENMAVDLGGSNDPIASAQSIGRTIVVKLEQKAIKDLPAQPKVKTPDLTPGVAPVLIEPTAPVPVVDDKALQATVDGLLKNGNYSGAISALRDAVDAAPFDPERRTMLITALQDKNPEYAAAEAHRAAMMLPDHSEFHMLAARAWMQAGHPKEAQDELNIAVSTAPSAPATRLMLGELALENGDVDHALTHIDAALKADPTPEGYFLRALCRALLGGVDGVKLDLEAMAKAQPTQSASDIAHRHKIAIAVLDAVTAHDSIEIRDLIQKVAVKPKDAGLRDELAGDRKRLASRIAFMEMLAAPAAIQKTHDRWLLAEKLLAQSLVDIETFIGGTDDALTDARMNLGEGIKQAQQARSESAG